MFLFLLFQVLITLTVAIPVKPISGLLESFKPSFLKPSKSVAVAPMPITMPGALAGIRPSEAKIILLENARSFRIQAQAIDTELAPKLAPLQKQLDTLASNRPLLLQKLSQTKSEAGKDRIRIHIAKNLQDREILQDRIAELQRRSRIMHRLATDSYNAAKAL